MTVGAPLLEALASRADDPLWLALWRGFSFLGSAGFFTAALPVLFAVLPWPKALRVLLAFGLAVTASEWIKAAVARPRIDPAVFGLDAPLEEGGEFASPAFPSGHAAVGCAFWGTLARVLGRPAAVAAAALLVAALSFSRLALLRHDLVDVGAGLLLGLLVVAGLAAADRGLAARLGALPWVEQASLWALPAVGAHLLAGLHSVTVVAGVVGGAGAGTCWAVGRAARIERMGRGRGLLRAVLGVAGAVAVRALAGLGPWGETERFALYFVAGLWVGGFVPALTGGAYRGAGRGPAAQGPPRPTPGPAAGSATG